VSGFHFSLQALLDQKAAIERALREQANRCKANFVAANQRLRRLHDDLRACDGGEDLRARALRQEYLDVSIHAQSAIVNDCEATLASAQRRLRDAARETKALEQLRQRRFDAYIDQQELAEEEELDEINLRRNLLR